MISVGYGVCVAVLRRKVWSEMSKYRLDRINEDIKRELAKLLRELKDPRIPAIVSIVAVNVSGDLRYAKAYISTVKGGEDTKNAVKGLQNAAGYIRREMSHRVELRYQPEFLFYEDDSIEHGIGISKMLKEIIKDEGVGNDEE